MYIQIQNKDYQSSVVLLQQNKTQDYSWGCKDKNCYVGLMTKQNLPSYAQFWMGVHPNGQSKLNKQKSLKQYLRETGRKQIEFLFKILSIQKCLSIQAHPNQQQAKQLHQKFPNIYVDDRDKPQMFLTISDQFQLFLGFIEFQQLNQLLKIQPFSELSDSLPNLWHRFKIVAMIKKLVSLNQTQISQAIQKLFKNINLFEEKRQRILIRLYDQFKNDIGILVSCLLQYHILKKGQCFGIEAGVPHAYIKGQCFQLMKNSDNVVRLGLTPKAKDIPNLLKILNNNIDRNYCKVQSREDSFIKIFSWKSYSITICKLLQTIQKLQILSDSIGIIINGQLSINSDSQNDREEQIIEKNVIFIKKGIYNLRGKGQLILSNNL